jgi:uncharacterized membrane protein YphA (DoxX/SURF4 family)
MWGFQDGQFTGDDAAALANAGVVTPVSTPSVTQTQPDEDPAPDEGGDATIEDGASQDGTVSGDGDPAPIGADASGEPAQDALPGHEGGDDASVDGAGAEAAEELSEGVRGFTGDDFDEPVQRKQFFLITARIYESSQPNELGSRYLPGWAGRDRGPEMLGYLVFGMVVVGSVFVLLGFLTRLAALGLMGVMLATLWVTQIAPVMLGSAPGWLGFLPAHESYSIEAWSGLLWQLLLLAGAFAVLCTGSGAISLDRFLMGSSKKGPKIKSKRLMPELDGDSEKRPI